MNISLAKKLLLFSLCALTVNSVNAAVTPTPSKKDARLREVMYSPDEIYKINIILGVGTRIILDKDEKIIAAAPGFGANCEEVTMDWCIVANVGASEIYVKAKSKAKDANNLEVTTDKRVYSFDFVLNEKFKRDIDGMFRVTFKYPQETKKVDVEAVAATLVQERLDTKNKPRNWNYAKEAMPGSEGIDPSLAYDDGRFTYFKFAGNKQMPAVFVVENDGKESIAATHVEGLANDTLVVHRVAKRFVLRLDGQVIGIWNDSFNQIGVTAPDGVTVEGLKRVTRGQQ